MAAATAASAEKLTDANREQLAALEEETKLDFKRARLLQLAILSSLAAILITLLGSLFEGLTPFNIDLAKSASSDQPAPV